MCVLCLANISVVFFLCGCKLLSMLLRMQACRVGNSCCMFESFSGFNTGKALNVFGDILIDIINSDSGNSLNRTSALGVDSGAIAASLSLREADCSPSLVYKTSILIVLQRLVFILGGCFRWC